MMQKFISTFLLLCFSVSLHAVPLYIDHDDAGYWTSTDLRLDFMDLTITEGFTYDQLVVETMDGGIFQNWRLANSQESRALYQLFSGGLDSHQGWAEQHYDNALLWFRLFGHSPGFNANWDNASDSPKAYVNWVQIFNEDKIAAHVAINSTTSSGKIGWFDAKVFGFNAWSLNEAYSNAPYAGLLTRKTNHDVTEPSLITLMLLGMFLLILRRAGCLRFN